ncbi:LysR family transcriptional regulator [Acrocarpospora pleiomorpha]|uniref:LysR family transcriptional regulator n=1 Tax=Acrocarpospora pleiomorpha TaxID=90975 RepID=A0A5M3XUX3_9ACTN|nr:LysR substrate-binding domain-containing protein [Acrocarpospora pleiomorpha]GES24700.1 LysR family transcriptional regulator [Acrocarpospora pleiomorpha]
MHVDAESRIDWIEGPARSAAAPPFSLRQLWYFVAVAEAGSISAAAESLRVSHSAVSLAVTELERTLKVQLCVRRKAHGIILTQAGHETLRRARELLRQAEDMNLGVRGTSLNGPLSLGCYLTLAPTLLPRLLAEFGRVNPAVTVSFSEDTADALQRRALEGELELVILYDMTVQPGLERVELFRARPHVVLPADHPLALASDTHVSLRDLADEPMVLYDSSPSSTHTLLLCTQAGIRPKVRHTTTNFETARGLVGRGLGWAILIQRPPNDRTYEDLQVAHRDIVELEDYSVAVILGWAAGSKRTRRAEAFAQHCIDTFRPRADRAV